MININYTKFEHLPNELLFGVFEYIDIRDLFYGFWGLNKRINQLLRSLQNLSFNLEQYEPALISLFANQINQLIVNTWQDIDLNQFPFLQSLILHQITGNQLRQIRSEYMPYLVYLSTSSIPEFSLMPQLAQRIFSNEMPTIRYVDLGHVHVPYLRMWSQSPSLHSVSIHSTNPTIVPFILISCPNLVYLRVTFLINTIPIFHNSPSIQNHPLKHFVLSDPYHKLSFSHIYTLLAFIPNVRRIQLNFLCKVPFIHFLQSLLSRLRYLNQFDCNIDDASTDKVTTIETIQQTHPCFYRIQCSTSDFNFRTFTTESNK
ncbi:unnamed protein product [Rotaria sp. Silwood2]|nr:unnamed protein product [Rotaria sp. Silwood2]CAF3323351.1 unnamed protein product [Rotaria sp. Silwood2]CAF3504667.1 unnamed protein product [Rotaria sp. Silwood2]CAF4279845.1 unnamed protein product [Rotaria sp. Silwood2]CAF4724391.1 unnamed protein product [Rotaria sp. Silwood2]